MRILILMTFFLAGCSVSEKQSSVNNSAYKNTTTLPQTSNTADNTISFSQWTESLPTSLPSTCVEYMSGCNRCSLNFYQGDFSGYACTEIGCASEPYECLVEHPTDYFTIPKPPANLVFPKKYSLSNNCAAVLYSNDGQPGYLSLDFKPEGFRWSDEFKPYQIEQLFREIQFFEFLKDKALCVADIKGNDLMYHPENQIYWDEYNQLQAIQHTQNLKNSQQCLSYVEDCEQTTLYYRPNRSEPPSRYGGIKTYTRDFPNCETASKERECLLEWSEFDLKTYQDNLDLTKLNTPALTSDRSLCFNRVETVNNGCVRYESECEVCEVLLDPVRETWRWDIQSKGCTRKFIQENGGLPLMQCASYQN